MLAVYEATYLGTPCSTYLAARHYLSSLLTTKPFPHFIRTGPRGSRAAVGRCRRLSHNHSYIAGLGHSSPINPLLPIRNPLLPIRILPISSATLRCGRKQANLYALFPFYSVPTPFPKQIVTHCPALVFRKLRCRHWNFTKRRQKSAPSSVPSFLLIIWFE